MYHLTTFDGVTLPTYNRETSMPVAAAQNGVVQTAAGAFDVHGDGEAPPALPSTLTLRCVVAEDVAVNQRVAVNLLRKLGRKRGRLYRVADDNATDRHFAIARLTQIGQTRPGRAQGYAEFDLTFQLLSEWKGSSHGTGWELDSGVLLDTDNRELDESPPVVLTSSPQTFTADNDGTATQHDVRFELVAGSAPVTLLRVRSSEAGIDWSWTGTVPVGGLLVIDCAATRVVVDGAPAYSGFTIGAAHRHDTWCPVPPGETELSVSYVGGGTGSTLAIVFNDGWK